MLGTPTAIGGGEIPHEALSPNPGLTQRIDDERGGCGAPAQGIEPRARSTALCRERRD
jgi:hypothetical protein